MGTSCQVVIRQIPVESVSQYDEITTRLGGVWVFQFDIQHYPNSPLIET